MQFDPPLPLSHGKKPSIPPTQRGYVKVEVWPGCRIAAIGFLVQIIRITGSIHTIRTLNLLATAQLRPACLTLTQPYPTQCIDGQPGGSGGGGI